ELRDGGEGGPRVSPADNVAEDAQVRARRDRQELGEALEETQDDRFEEVHRVILSGLEQEIGEHGAPEGEGVERHALVDAVEHRREVELGPQTQGCEAVAGDAELAERL